MTARASQPSIRAKRLVLSSGFMKLVTRRSGHGYDRLWAGGYLLFFTCTSGCFHGHRRPVTQHLGDALRDFRGVVAHADDGIRSEFTRMGKHLVVGIAPRPLTQLGIERDVPAKETLDARPDVSNHRTR